MQVRVLLREHSAKLTGNILVNINQSKKALRIIALFTGGRGSMQIQSGRRKNGKTHPMCLRWSRQASFVATENGKTSIRVLH